MKHLLLLISFLFVCNSYADDSIVTTVDSLSNVANSAALEVCGTAVHREGTKPLLVTVQHDESFYTTLTAPNNKWCVVVKRWTFSGKVNASAVPLI